MAEEEFRANPVYIIPILVSLLISISCAFLISQSKVELTSLTILPESGYGPLFNATIFVLATGFGATMIYFLLKRGVHRFLRFLMGIMFAVLTFSLVILYSELIFVIINLELSLEVFFLLASFATAFVILEVFLKRGKVSEIIVLAIGGATGTLLGASIPTFSAVLILLLLAVYDVITVFHGPVGKIAAKGLEHLPGASFAFRNIYVGLGDLTFYSMLVSHVLLSFGWETCVAATFGVLAGSFLSFKMVEKRGVFPGLPLSVLFGLLASLIGLVGLK